VGKITVSDGHGPAHQVLGQLDTVIDTTAQKGVRESAFIVAGDHHDGWAARSGLDRFALVEGVVKFVPVQSSSWSRSEITGHLVDLVDEHHGIGLAFIGPPQGALLEEILPILTQAAVIGLGKG